MDELATLALSLVFVFPCVDADDPRSFAGTSALNISVPEHQRTQYNEALGRLLSAVKEFEIKVPMYYVMSGNVDHVRKLVMIVSCFHSFSILKMYLNYLVDNDGEVSRAPVWPGQPPLHC